MFELCSRCGKPLVNEHNLSILRKLIFGGLATSAVFGGFIGAVALSAIGFTSAGVAAGSFAAAWQGPLTAAGSTFAVLQSLGATGLGPLLFGTVGTLSTTGTALYVLRQCADMLDWCQCDGIVDNDDEKEIVKKKIIKTYYTIT